MSKNQIEKIDLTVPSKKGVQSFVSNIEKNIEEGWTTGAEAFIFAKFLEESAKKIKESEIVQEAAKNDIQNENNLYKGSKVTQRAGRTTYVFCEELSQVKDEIKDFVKSCEDTAKTLNPGEVAEKVNPFTGEVFQIKNAIKRQGETFVVSLRKE